MRKILSTLIAVAALAGPTGLASADDSAAGAAKNASDRAAAAAVKAKVAADKAKIAADEAKLASDEAMLAGDEAKTRGEAAEKAGDEARTRSSTAALRGMPAANYEPGVKQARRAIRALERADPGLARFFDGAAGYAVFASVGKGGMGLGGAYGTGVLYEKGEAIGEVTLTQVTVGLQLGGQAYSEVIFFETEKALANFKKSEFTMAAQVSAVAAAAGASANARYVEGVSVFTLAKAGLMAEASVGGQKFSYHAFGKVISSSR